MPVEYHYGKFPPKDLDWLRLQSLIGPANLALGEFKGLLDAIPNPHMLLAPLTAQEAVLTSRIEGTEVTLGEVLKYEAEGNRVVGNTSEIREVINYRKAVLHTVERMDELPLCGRLLKEAHAILMEGVRGTNKDPGNYKRITNFIGAPGSTKETAKFIPITPDKLEDSMSKWEKFLNNGRWDSLIQLGIAHAEFEALHPFLDGNGRIGRMLVPLFLFERKILNSPDFYISEYLEAKRELYYERLLAVSRDDDWTGWCAFFLKALTAQARENTRKARSIMELYEKRKSWISQKTSSRYAIQTLDFMFARPIFSISDVAKELEIARTTASDIIHKIQDDMLQEISPALGRYPALYAYFEPVNIAEEKGDFQ